MARQRPEQRQREKEAERQVRSEAAQRRQGRRRILVTAAVGAVVAAGILFAATRPEPAALAAVETFPNQGQEHVDPAGPAPDYNSDPPTSGPHAPRSAPCGIYRQPVPDPFQVHDLEHGTVVIQYQPGIEPDTRDQLEVFARDAGTHVIVAPREGADAPITLTAWTKRLILDDFDREAIETFYGRFAQNGPERGVPCPLEVDEPNQ